MKSNKTLFIGYFRSDFRQEKLQSLIKSFCPGIMRLDVRKKKIGFVGSVYYAQADFSDVHFTEDAARFLSGRKLFGHPLIVRSWVERTAANERRIVGWRGQHWSGTERRIGERRTYREPRLDTYSEPPKWLKSDLIDGYRVEMEHSDEIKAIFSRIPRFSDSRKLTS